MRVVVSSPWKETKPKQQTDISITQFWQMLCKRCVEAKRCDVECTRMHGLNLEWQMPCGGTDRYAAYLPTVYTEWLLIN
jgi:hypothetical protein